MDEYVYYWTEHDQYCYKSELDAFVAKYGHNYSAHLSSEFFRDIWIEKD